MAEERASYEFVDRRTGRGGAAEAGAAAAPPPSEGTPPTEPGTTPEGAPAAATDVRALLAMTVGMLAEAAWVKMGLRLDPISQKMERDLDQARLAIDCLAALVERLGPLEDERTRRELTTLLTDLRLNFVRQQASG